jgi:ribosomal protein S6
MRGIAMCATESIAAVAADAFSMSKCTVAAVLSKWRVHVESSDTIGARKLARDANKRQNPYRYTLANFSHVEYAVLLEACVHHSALEYTTCGPQS